jgi:hypothetical protein
VAAKGRNAFAVLLKILLPAARNKWRAHDRIFAVYLRLNTAEFFSNINAGAVNTFAAHAGSYQIWSINFTHF